MWLLQGQRNRLLNFCMLVVAIAGQIVDHMQEPGLTFFSTSTISSSLDNMIDDNQASLIYAAASSLGDWIRIEFSAPVKITTMYLLAYSNKFVNGCPYCGDEFFRVDIYAGPYLDYTLNTQCASYVLPEGIFNCGGVLGQYITLVIADNSYSYSYMEFQILKVFSEEEVGQYATGVTTVEG